MVQNGWSINTRSSKPENLPRKRKNKFREWLASFLPAIGEYLYYVAQESSMHGLAHITAKGRHPLERALWLVALLACISGAIWVPLSSYDILEHRPTVMSMERDYTSWNTSFPAITVCPNSRVDQLELQLLSARLFERLENVSLSEITFFLNTLADTTLINLPSAPFDDLPGIEPEEFLPMVVELAPSWTYTVKGPGQDGGEDDHAGVSMDPVMTEKGICYSYNSAFAPFFNISLENQTWTDADRRRILKTPVVQVNPLDGRVLGQLMKVALGFTVFVHGPFEIADVSAVGIQVFHGYVKTIGLTAVEVFTTPAAADLPPEKRKCRLAPECPTGVSPPIYSFTLCRRRCRARLAIRFCGCVPHWDSFLNEGKVCSAKGLRCLGSYQGNCSPTDALVRIEEPETRIPIQCNCMPSCDYVSYTIETSDVSPWFLGAGFEYGISKYPRSRLRRDVFYTPKDVLVSFGSAAGLFLGCSVLSFVEFIYFFTLGLYWYIRRRKKAKIAEQKKDDRSDERGDNHAENDTHHYRKRFMSSNAWRRRFLDSGSSQTKLLAWVE